MMMNLTTIIRRGAAALTVAIATAGLAACGTQETVCRGTPERLVVLAFSSTSDLATARELTPEVARQAAARAAQTCGSVGAGLVTDRVESDLAIDVRELHPTRRSAPNRMPDVRRMRRVADRFYARRLLGPLARVRASSGSPFLGALAKLAEELDARRSAGRVVVALVGDGIAVEPAPGGRKVDFRRRAVDMRALSAFVPLLRPLARSCVVLLGAGARSNAQAGVLRRARALLENVLADARIDFVATRSGQLPSACKTT